MIPVEVLVSGHAEQPGSVLGASPSPASWVSPAQDLPQGENGRLIQQIGVRAVGKRL